MSDNLDELREQISDLLPPGHDDNACATRYEICSKCHKKVYIFNKIYHACKSISWATQPCDCGAQEDLDKIMQLFRSHLEEAERAVDRFEVIDNSGRAYVKGSIYGSPVKVKLSYQDGGKTLKVFVDSRLVTEPKKEE